MIGLLPCSAEEIDILCRPTALRPIWHYGIDINSLRYNSPELQHLRQRIGISERDRTIRDVVVYLNYDDVGEILIYDEYIKVFIHATVTDQRYDCGLTLHMHKLVRKNLSIQNKNPEHSDIIARAKRKIRKDIEEQKKSALSRLRRKAAKVERRRLDTSTQSPLPEQNFSSQIETFALEEVLRRERESYPSSTLSRGKHGK